MSSYDEAREAAQKCASSYTHLGMLTNGDAGATVSEMVDDILDAFLAKLSETHAVVPREPTEAMLDAGSPRPAHWPPPGEDRRRDAAVMADREALRCTYRAMLAQEVKP